MTLVSRRTGPALGGALVLAAAFVACSGESGPQAMDTATSFGGEGGTVVPTTSAGSTSTPDPRCVPGNEVSVSGLVDDQRALAGTQLEISVECLASDTLVTACYASEDQVETFDADCRAIDDAGALEAVSHTLAGPEGSANLVLPIESRLAGGGRYALIIRWTNPGPERTGSRFEQIWFTVVEE